MTKTDFCQIDNFIPNSIPLSSIKKNMEEPIMKHGKICYLEIPSEDIERSRNFYKAVFGWESRVRSDGSVAFDDTVGQVSGTWVLGKKSSSNPGIIIHVMVKNANETMKLIETNGGKIVEGIGAHYPEVTAKFADPFGNILSIYQEPSLAGD